jgi:hypothetical protein
MKLKVFCAGESVGLFDSFFLEQDDIRTMDKMDMIKVETTLLKISKLKML